MEKTIRICDFCGASDVHIGEQLPALFSILSYNNYNSSIKRCSLADKDLCESCEKAVHEVADPLIADAQARLANAIKQVEEKRKPKLPNVVTALK